MEFPPETVNGYQRQFTFTLLLKETINAVFNVHMSMIGEGNESNYEAKCFSPFSHLGQYMEEDVLGQTLSQYKSKARATMLSNSAAPTPSQVLRSVSL